MIDCVKEGRHSMKAPLRITMVALMALAAIAVVVTGCGSSSKPEYCSNVSELEESVDELGNVQLESNSLATLEADLNKVQTNADAVVTSAKEDFPSETSALESSVSSLSDTINKLPPSPTTEQLLPLAPEISSTVKAAKNCRAPPNRPANRARSSALRQGRFFGRALMKGLRVDFS